MKKNNKKLLVIISAVIAILCTSCGETTDSYKNEATSASDSQKMDTERSDSSLEEPVSSNHVLEGIWHGVSTSGLDTYYVFDDTGGGEIIYDGKSDKFNRYQINSDGTAMFYFDDDTVPAEILRNDDGTLSISLMPGISVTLTYVSEYSADAVKSILGNDAAGTTTDSSSNSDTTDTTHKFTGIWHGISTSGLDTYYVFDDMGGGEIIYDGKSDKFNRYQINSDGTAVFYFDDDTVPAEILWNDDGTLSISLMPGISVTLSYYSDYSAETVKSLF